MSDQEQPFFGIDPASIEVRVVTTTYRYNQYGAMIREERTETSHREPAHSVRPTGVHNTITWAEGVNLQDAIRILNDAMTQAVGLPAELLHDDDQSVQGLRNWSNHDWVGGGRLDRRIEEAFRALGDRSTIGYVSQSARPVACHGCKQYHGQTYGANRLVCGIYPYGPESEQCPDWEEDWIKTLESPAWFTNLDFSDRQLWLDRLRELKKDPARYNPLMRGRIRLGMVRSGVIDDNQLAAFLEQVRSEE